MIFVILFLIGFLHLLVLNLLTFTAWPEMLSYPYLFSKGFILYKDFIAPYPPGLILILSAVFTNFGFSPFVLKTITWILILLTDLMVFIIIKKISKSNAISSIFLIFYVFLQSFLDGNMLWFDFTGVLPLLLGFYFFLNWNDKQNLKYLLLIGLFLSLAVIIKQTNVIYFLAFGIIYLFLKKQIILKEIVYLIFGCLIILIPFLFYIIKINVISEFWNWIILYPLTEWSKFPGYVNFNISKRQAIVSFILFSPLFFSIIYWRQFIKNKIFLIIFLFLITSLITVYPRFSFFHMQPAVAFLTIIFAKIFAGIPQKVKYMNLLFLILITFLVIFFTYKSVVGNQIRFYGDVDKRITSEIIKNMKDNKNVFLLGINSSEYVFADKVPPKHWSDNFGWYLEISGVQKWVIEGLINDHPKTIFWRVPSKGNWYDLGVYQPKDIVKYIMLNYHKTGNIEKDIEIWEKD